MKELWVDKYRPKRIDGYVWRDTAQKRQVETWIKDKSIPNLLLSGTPGIGKTTMAKILCNEIGIEPADLLEVNASRETGIDFIRNKIVPFISSIAWGPFKVVLLDEADRLSPNAQDSLKGIIEEYSNFARFILTCNNPNMIVPALHSRCQQFHFSKLDQEQFLLKTIDILTNEGVQFDDITLSTFVMSAYPDLRKCINLLQQNVSEDQLHNPNQEDSGTLDYKFEMAELFKAGKISEARKLLCSKARPEEMGEIFRWMYNNVEVFGKDEATQNKAILIIKQGLVDHSMVIDPEINLSATLIRLANL